MADRCPTRAVPEGHGVRRLSGDTQWFSLRWCSACGQLRAILSGRQLAEEASIRGKVRRSRHALVATEERAIPMEEARWTAVFAEVGNRSIRERSSQCLGQFSATRRNCGRGPSSARRQGDTETAVAWRYKTPKADSLDALRAG